MNDRQQRRVTAYANSSALLAAAPKLSRAIAKLAGELALAVARVEELVIAQQLARNARTGHSKVGERLFDDLRTRHMLPISRRAGKLLKNLPGVEAACRVPHASASIGTLIVAAEAMAEAVKGYRKEFLHAGFKPDFLTALRSATRELEQSRSEVDRAHKQLVATTAALPAELARAREAIRALDAMLPADPTVPSSLLANWEKVRKIRARLGRPKKGSPAAKAKAETKARAREAREKAAASGDTARETTTDPEPRGKTGETS